MAIPPVNQWMVDKQLGCWIFYRGVVGFVFKFGSNWTNFDVSTPFFVLTDVFSVVGGAVMSSARARHSK